MNVSRGQVPWGHIDKQAIAIISENGSVADRIRCTCRCLLFFLYFSTAVLITPPPPPPFIGHHQARTRGRVMCYFLDNKLIDEIRRLTPMIRSYETERRLGTVICHVAVTIIARGHCYIRVPYPVVNSLQVTWWSGTCWNQIGCSDFAEIYPAGTRLNNKVFITSKRRCRRRFDVMKTTLSLRHYCVICPLG